MSKEVPIEAVARDREAAAGRRKAKKKEKENWKKTLYVGSISSVVVLLFNVGFLAWSAGHGTAADGRSVLFNGECQKARHLTLGFHLVINVLATLLLMASNYGMQCLVAPTRQELDRVHQRCEWLDIGVSSLRNLRQIPRRKLVLWTILALSSLPLHLFYNSTIFAVVTNNEYGVVVGAYPFTSFSPESLRQQYADFPATDPVIPSFEELRLRELNGEFRRLEKLECVEAYAVNYQSAFSNLLVITNDIDPNQDGFNFALVYDGLVEVASTDSGVWICPLDVLSCSSDSDEFPAIADNWTVYALTPMFYTAYYTVDYCLAQAVPEQCRVEYSLPLMIVVIVFNVLKASVLLGITLTMDGAPLLTTGDAVAEFLRRPDPFTLARESWKYHQTRKRWHTVVSMRRWIACIILVLGGIAISIGLLVYAFHTDSGMGNLSDSLNLGFGSVDTDFLIRGTHFPNTLLPNTIIANMPQLVFSLFYFVSNGALTAMTEAHEWSKYALHRTGLRVSTPPKGKQRSSYFFSIPYWYSVPELILTIAVHWLMSESLFLVSLEAYSPSLARLESLDTETCGYSPTAIICTLAISLFMILCLVGLGRIRRFKSGMPIAGSSSLAISTACHPYPSLEESGEVLTAPEIDTLPLQWGVVPDLYQGSQHCSFFHEDVSLPVDGNVYK